MCITIEYCPMCPSNVNCISLRRQRKDMWKLTSGHDEGIFQGEKWVHRSPGRRRHGVLEIKTVGSRNEVEIREVKQKSSQSEELGRHAATAG